MCGVTRDAQPLVPHDLANETPQPRQITFGDMAAIEPLARTVFHASIELVPDRMRILSLCLPANEPADSGAEPCAAPEIASRRVAKESISQAEICPKGHRATRAIAQETIRVRRIIRS
jgi:hypothetical protein